MVQRGGDFDRWDLEVRGGLLGCARTLMTIEEHGAGRQLIRFRTWPKFSSLAIATDVVFALLALGATLDQAWVAWIVLTLIVGLFSFRLFQECAAAESAVLYTVADRVKNNAYVPTALKRSKVREA